MGRGRPVTRGGGLGSQHQTPPPTPRAPGRDHSSQTEHTVWQQRTAPDVTVLEPPSVTEARRWWRVGPPEASGPCGSDGPERKEESQSGAPGHQQQKPQAARTRTARQRAVWTRQGNPPLQTPLREACPAGPPGKGMQRHSGSLGHQRGRPRK